MTAGHPQESFDVVVLGAGIAGLTAACVAAEAGLQVALLEKQANIGGSSAMSGGFFAFSDTDEQRAAGVRDSPELFLADLQNIGDHANDDALLLAYLDAEIDVYRWLKARGVSFSALELSSGQSVARSHLSPIRTLLYTLADDFVAAGGILRTGETATALHREDDRVDGRVMGVTTESANGVRRYSARHGVVLATGGFSRSAELLRIFAPEQLAAIPYGGAGNTGDGLKLAWKLGAGLADMWYISATYGSHPDTTDAFHELLTAYYSGAIIVNTAGGRFVDESQSYKTLGAACLSQPEGLGFQIFDRSVRATSHPGVPLSDIGMLEDLGHVHSADTLDALAVMVGIDPVGLAGTVDAYNDAISHGHPDPFGRSALCNGVGDLLPIVDAPFYAYPAKPLMTSTYCGVTIDPGGRVTDIDGSPIEGLFAIGEVTGGFHGAAYMTGTSLGKGAVFGYLVARALADATVDAARFTPGAA